MSTLWRYRGLCLQLVRSALRSAPAVLLFVVTVSAATQAFAGATNLTATSLTEEHNGTLAIDRPAGGRQALAAEHATAAATMTSRKKLKHAGAPPASDDGLRVDQCDVPVDVTRCANWRQAARQFVDGRAKAGGPRAPPLFRIS